VEKTQIEIWESEPKLAEVKRFSNGIIVERAKVRSHDLIVGLLHLLSPDEIFSELISQKELFEDYIQPLLEFGEKEEILPLLKTIFGRLSYSLDQDIMGEILMVIAQNQDLSWYSDDAVSLLIENMAKRTYEISDHDAFCRIIRIALEKSNFLEVRDTNLVESVLDKLITLAENEEQRERVHQLFRTLAKKADRTWIREVLAPYLERQKIVKTPLLRKNIIAYMEELDGTKVVLVEVDKGRFTIEYHGTTFENVGHPKLLFAFYVLRNRIKYVEVMAVKDLVVKPETKIYHYPFSNVYSNFKACWPDVENMKIERLDQLSTLPYMFIKTNNNDHLYRGVNLRELLYNLQNQDFNDDMLEFTGKTVGGYFEIE
jgi:hypothetical protein